MTIEDNWHENRIQQMKKNFTNIFKIVFSIFSNTILCERQDLNLNISFSFKIRSRQILFNKDEKFILYKK